MNTNGWEIERLGAFQAQAKKDLEALPREQRDIWMRKAAARYRAQGWEYFAQSGKDACALLAYIEALPEPPADTEAKP